MANLPKEGNFNKGCWGCGEEEDGDEDRGKEGEGKRRVYLRVTRAVLCGN